MRQTIKVHWEDPVTGNTGAFRTAINGTTSSIRQYYFQNGGWLNIGGAGGTDRIVKVRRVEFSADRPLVCQCNRGYASEYDGMCKFCREKHSGVRRTLQKKVGVRHRGDGMTIEQYRKATGN